VSDNTFFVSESLAARLTADDLERQSRNSIETDHTHVGSGAIDSTVYFKDEHMICTVFQCEIFEDLHSLTFLTGVAVGMMLQKFSSKAEIVKITLNDEIGDELIAFDVSGKSYNVVITKCKDTLNYKLKLIFI